MMVEASLRDLLRHGRKFERMRTEIPGVFVTRIPRSKIDPDYLAIEVNPLDAQGNPVHRIGVIIRNKKDLDEIRATLAQEEIDELFKVIEGVQSE